MTHQYVFARVFEINHTRQVEPLRALLTHCCIIKLEESGEDPRLDRLVCKKGDSASMVIEGIRTTHIGSLRNRSSDQAEVVNQW